MTKKAPPLLYVFCIVFALILIADAAIHVIRFGFYDIINIFWFCNFATLVFIIGVIFKIKEIPFAVLAAAVPAQFFWIVDFLIELFGQGMGRTTHLFELDIALFGLSVALHAMLIPVSLWASFKFGFYKRSIFITIVIFIFFLLGFTYFISDDMNNLNCMKYPCDLSLEEDTDTIMNNDSYFTPDYALKRMGGFLAFELGLLMIYPFLARFANRRYRQKPLFAKQLFN